MGTVPVDTALEAALKHDRVVVITALSFVIALSWTCLLADAGMGMSMSKTARMSLPEVSATLSEAHMADVAMGPAVWTPRYAVLMFFMWCIMMVAMMLPGAAPMILLFAKVNRKQRDTGRPYVATSLFAIGYLAAWAAFSLVAMILQWSFQRIGILSPMLAATNAIFGGSLLFAAGLYQLTPIKHACLRRCRSPLGFLAAHWRQGARGALRMGIVHGALCIGCCGFLMGLMFFGGVMNLYWIAGLAGLVLLEKTIPAGHWLGYATGVALLLWSAWVLARAF